MIILLKECGVENENPETGVHTHTMHSLLS